MSGMDPREILQKSHAFARGEGANADASTLRGNTGSRTLVIGTGLVVILFAAAFWVFTRPGAMFAEATAVEVDLAAEEVSVDFAAPEGCWSATGNSTAAISRDEVIFVDLRIEPSEDCSTRAVLPLLEAGRNVPDDPAVRQVGCDNGVLDCGAPVTATVVR